MTATMIEQLKDMDNGTFLFNHHQPNHLQQPQFHQEYRSPNNIDLCSSVTFDKKATVVKQQSTSPMDDYQIMDRIGTMPQLEEVNFVEMAMIRRDSGTSANFVETKTAKGIDQLTVKLS